MESQENMQLVGLRSCVFSWKNVLKKKRKKKVFEAQGIFARYLFGILITPNILSDRQYRIMRPFRSTTFI